MDYEDMLDRAYKGLPEILKEESRFQTPEIESVIQGRVTVVQNFGEVIKTLNRSPDMLGKYFLGEMGTSGEYDSTRLILKGQFRTPQLQDKLEAFVGAYVMCPECKRPDTTIVHEKRMSFLKCEACGARHSIATIKVEGPPKEQVKELAVGDEIVGARILAVDVGAGTQDILFFDPEKRPENNVKSVLPSQTRILAHRISELNEDILITGEIMGGGPITMAILNHLNKGHRVVMTEVSARTVRDDLDEVREEGIEIVTDEKAQSLDMYRIETKDVDLDFILDIIQRSGEGLPDFIGVCGCHGLKVRCHCRGPTRNWR
jgi:putative translation initiation factor aIF-2 beta subunit